MARILFIAAFFGITLLPISQMALGFSVGPQINENRTLAPRPVVKWSHPLEWMTEADKWFSDHFGFRSFLIRLKTQIDFSLFSFSDRVHIGSAGQLFYRSVIDREKLASDLYLRQNRGAMLRNVHRLAEALDSKGIKLILSVNLLADRFVGERLPANAPDLSGLSQIDELVRQLSIDEKIVYLNPTPILQRIQKSRNAFYLTDFHWNVPAGAEVSNALVEKISAMENQQSLVATKAVKTTEMDFSGGIASFMPLFWPPREKAPQLSIEPAKTVSELVPQPDTFFEVVVRQSTPATDALAPLVLVGDSFCDAYTVAGMQNYFARFSRIRWSYGLKFSSIVERLPSDTKYMFVQFIEAGNFAFTALADTADIDKAIATIDRR